MFPSPIFYGDQEPASVMSTCVTWGYVYVHLLGATDIQTVRTVAMRNLDAMKVIMSFIQKDKALTENYFYSVNFYIGNKCFFVKSVILLIKGLNHETSK